MPSNKRFSGDEKTDKMADLGSLHTFVYACPLLFLSGIDKVFVFLYLSLLMRR